MNRSAVWRRVLIMGAGLGVVWAVVGLHRAPEVPLPTLLVNFDVSGSMSRAEREQGCDVLNRVLTQVFPNGAQVVLTAFDHKPRILFDAAVRDQQEMVSTEKKLLAMTTRDHVLGTDPACALESSLRDARKLDARGEAVALLDWTDGEDATPGRTKKLAAEMARLPHLKAFWVAGVTLESTYDIRAQAMRTFECLGERGIISGPNELTQGLERFGHLMEGS